MLPALLHRLAKDAPYRIRVFLLASFLLNIVYSAFLMIVSLLYSSKWFFVMSVYYGLLSLSRIFVYSQTAEGKSTTAKIKTMHACGWFLLLINATVSVMMFILMRGHQPIQHHEITVITIATYTFSALTVAIVGSVKFIKRNDYVYSSAKIISLISASVSLVTLTNTMLSTWGDESTALLRSIILPILCGVVSAFIVVCAILIILKTVKDLKYEKERK
jgi:hypothetical protein